MKNQLLCHSHFVELSRSSLDAFIQVFRRVSVLFQLPFIGMIQRFFELSAISWHLAWRAGGNLETLHRSFNSEASKTRENHFRVEKIWWRVNEPAHQFNVAMAHKTNFYLIASVRRSSNCVTHIDEKLSMIGTCQMWGDNRNLLITSAFEAFGRAPRMELLNTFLCLANTRTKFGVYVHGNRYCRVY